MNCDSWETRNKLNSTEFPAWESLQVKVQKPDGAQQVPLVEETELSVQGSQSI